MVFDVPEDDVISLTQDLFFSRIECLKYQKSATIVAPLSEGERAFQRSRWAEEVGKSGALLHALSLIIRTPWGEVDHAVREILSVSADPKELNTYAHRLFDALLISLTD